jgi:hypothetical protein
LALEKENDVESTHIKKIGGLWVGWPLFVVKGKTYSARGLDKLWVYRPNSQEVGTMKAVPK